MTALGQFCFNSKMLASLEKKIRKKNSDAVKHALNS